MHIPTAQELVATVRRHNYLVAEGFIPELWTEETSPEHTADLVELAEATDALAEWLAPLADVPLDIARSAMVWRWVKAQGERTL
jgi:hypothetical protein